MVGVISVGEFLLHLLIHGQRHQHTAGPLEQSLPLQALLREAQSVCLLKAGPIENVVGLGACAQHLCLVSPAVRDPAVTLCQNTEATKNYLSG